MNTCCFVTVTVLFLSYCYAATNIHAPGNGNRLLPAPEYQLRTLIAEIEANNHWVETPKIVASEEEIEDHQIVKRQSGLTLIDSITNTAALETAVVNKHNDLRSSEALQEGAALMEKMYGNSDLATFAKSVTDTCYFDHSSNADRSNKFGFSYFGENLAVTTGGSATPESLIQSWYNEKNDFDFASNSCPIGKMCGHYTQIVWGTSKYIGCAVTFCPVLSFPNNPSWSNAYYLACNYGPGGNYIGQRPYTKSTACSGCGHTCIQGLCDQNAATTTPAPTAAPTSAAATTTTQAPTTTSAAATTTTQAPTTTSAAATTTTQAPTSAAATTTTQAPTSAAATTTTQAPTTTSAAATTTTQAPTTTSAAATTTTSTAATTPVVTASTAVPLIPGCNPVDRNQYCAYYDTYYAICSSSSTNGYLDFAIRSCRSTCNLCQCRDYKDNCSAYVSKYRVCTRRTRNYWYGRKYCKKTCGLC